MDKIIIGTISKPQGIRGELKINPLTDDVNRFLKLKEIYFGEEIEKRAVRGCRISNGGVYMFIDGILTRNDAEKARGVFISIDKENAVNLSENKFFIVDIVGCRIYAENGECLGIIKSVIQNGAADIFEVEGEKIFMLPFVEGLAKEINIEQKRITVNAKRFSEVVCYED